MMYSEEFFSFGSGFKALHFFLSCYFQAVWLLSSYLTQFANILTFHSCIPIAFKFISSHLLQHMMLINLKVMKFYLTQLSYSCFHALMGGIVYSKMKGVSGHRFNSRFIFKLNSQEKLTVLHVPWVENQDYGSDEPLSGNVHASRLFTFNARLMSHLFTT